VRARVGTPPQGNKAGVGRRARARGPAAAARPSVPPTCRPSQLSRTIHRFDGNRPQVELRSPSQARPPYASRPPLDVRDRSLARLPPLRPLPPFAAPHVVRPGAGPGRPRPAGRRRRRRSLFARGRLAAQSVPALAFPVPAPVG